MRIIFCCVVLLLSATFLYVDKPASKQQHPATVLLITSKPLADAWQPFAQWKMRLGKSTIVITTAEITKRYKGADLQVALK